MTERWNNRDTSSSTSNSSTTNTGFGGDVPPQRKRLQLKPRSAKPSQGGAIPGGSSSKSNPFGAAKPREEVLATKGIDPSTIDARIAKKAAGNTRFTKEQDEELEIIRQELTSVEAELRRANEMELPEEAFRVKAEAKRAELHDLMTKFTAENASAEKEKPSFSSTRRFERPSERRKRLEQQRGGRDNRVDTNFNNARQNGGGGNGGGGTAYHRHPRRGDGGLHYI